MGKDNEEGFGEDDGGREKVERRMSLTVPSPN